MEKVKIAITGLGRSGWNIHAHLISQLPEKYEIIAVSDPDENRRKQAEEKFDCKSYEKFEDMLNNDEIEVVVVATPSHLHSSYSISALKKGKNVICEKPMATNLEDADKMIEVAKKEGKILTIFHNRRYSPDFLKVKEVIDTGVLGRIVLIKMMWHSFARRWDWQTLKKYGGGTLNNTGPHPVDQALQFFGEKEDPEIFCHMERTLTLGDAEDHVKIIFKGKISPMIDLEITSCCCYPEEPYLIMGTCGGLKGNYTKLQWKYFKVEKLPERKVQTQPTPDRSYNSEEIPWEKEEIWELPQNQHDYQLNFYIDLYETLKKNKPLKITPESARRVMWAIEKCHKIAGI
ncbi:MAG TPA: Gfo/Idh/MocA family oxidoreductase [bacterium]|nr:Gfo/Idh/MocA family oxidoreductase [bacterium]